MSEGKQWGATERLAYFESQWPKNVAGPAECFCSGACGGNPANCPMPPPPKNRAEALESYLDFIKTVIGEDAAEAIRAIA